MGVDVPSGAKQAAEKGQILAFGQGWNLQGLKPAFIFAAFTARLKSCPDTNNVAAGVFSQPVKPVPFKSVHRAES
jgi:hypothetical protein